MTVVAALVVGAVVGVLVGVLVGRLTGRLTGRVVRPGRRQRNAEPRRRRAAALSPADRVLDLLPTAAVLLDASGEVRVANAAARDLLIRAGALDLPELRELVRLAQRSGSARVADVDLDRGGFARRALAVRAEALPLGDDGVVLVVDDVTETRRVEAVRRDFVANVGHEIKTPVGALTLLADAALDARDDPEALRHFLSRIHHEANRLARLVQELLDLSRLQGGEPLPAPAEVLVDAVVEEAIDRVRPAADAKHISLVRGGDIGLVVHGDGRQLVTAVANLLDNAVAYSADGTSVAVGVHARDSAVEIAVKDEGIGIAAADQERIFERFYRVDAARSRATGGTGLGLAIVKHIVSNHAGEVTVWSQPGAGSTFTIRLPAVATGPAAPTAPARPREARAT